MNTMKTIDVNGRIIMYQIHSNANEIYTEYWTEFYEGYTIIPYKKYIFFGEQYIDYKPIYLFTLYIDIEDNIYTSDEINTLIQKYVNKMT